MNLTLYETITKTGDALVGVISPKTRYRLSFDVEVKAKMRLLVKDDLTNAVSSRLNNSLFFKSGSYYFEVYKNTLSNLVFNIMELEGSITNIVLEEV